MFSLHINAVRPKYEPDLFQSVLMKGEDVVQINSFRCNSSLFNELPHSAPTVVVVDQYGNVKSMQWEG